MATITNRRILLARRPGGMPCPDDFRIEDTREALDVPNGVRLKTLWLSVDPYMRARMSERPSYTAPTAIGDVMPGGAVSHVIASRNDSFAVGDIVVGYTGWQSHPASTGEGLQKLNPSLAPVQSFLGVLGMPGMTAYTGLFNIGEPKAGETLVVAAAAGAVGSAVGQMAKLKGCRVVGIAGGAAKTAYLVDELGFDVAIDHGEADFATQLAKACPNGIDIYFENVGGKVWQAVRPLLNAFARIPVCGTISNYNAEGPIPGDHSDEDLLRQTLFKRLRIQGFIVSDFMAQKDEFLRHAVGWFSEGKLRHREHVINGLDNAPAALISLLKGENFGKMLVKVADPG